MASCSLIIHLKLVVWDLCKPGLHKQSNCAFFSFSHQRSQSLSGDQPLNLKAWRIMQLSSVRDLAPVPRVPCLQEHSADSWCLQVAATSMCPSLVKAHHPRKRIQPTLRMRSAGRSLRQSAPMLGPSCTATTRHMTCWRRSCRYVMKHAFF